MRLAKFYIITCLLLPYLLRGQPAFYHLSTAEGLSDNNVSSVVRDRTGMLWIGTTEGLNSFDGNRINSYHKHIYPELPDNDIERILVDNENRLWLRTSSSFLTMLDEKRKFHRILIGDSTDNTIITGAFITQSRGLIVQKGRKHYFSTPGQPLQFTYQKIPFEDSMTQPTGFTYYINQDRAVYYRGGQLIVADYANMKIQLRLPIGGIIGANYVNDDLLMAFTGDGQFFLISIVQKKIIAKYSNLKDQHGKSIQGNLRNCTRISNYCFAFTSYFGGLYLVDLQTQKVEHYEHDPSDPRSIGGNNTFNIRYDSSGYLFVTTQSSGLHYFNLKEKQPQSKPYFIDAAKNIFDGYISSITQTDSIFWLGAQDRLIRWNKNTGATDYVPLHISDGSNLSGSETIREVYAAPEGKIWMGTSTEGLLVLDPRQNTLRQIKRIAGSPDTLLPSNWVNVIEAGQHQQIWIGTIRGVVLMDRNSFRIQRLKEHPLLNAISTINCTALWKDSTGRMWIGSTKGVWCHEEAKGQLKHYSIKEGLKHNTVYAINQDGLGNTYFATLGGLSILSSDGKIMTYDRSNALPNDRCEGILRDENGYMWIGNLSCIIRYDPKNRKFAIFQEGIGFNHAGFRIRCAFRMGKNEMYWGTDKGLLYFFPDQLNGSFRTLQPFIHSLQSGQQLYHFTSPYKISFPYSTPSFIFSFSSGELSGDKKNHLQYRLHGYDKDWVIPSSAGQAVYSRLPPGNYTFEIRASTDGMSWQEAPFHIQIKILKPWWQTIWFRLSCLALGLMLIWGTINHFKGKRKAAEARQAVAYFANTNHSYSSPRDIYWDICRNCISRLGFEDCVIYVPDHERKVLVQEAAYGPKNKGSNEVVNPIEIPFGAGIVGHAAISLKPELVSDTSRDSRYIVDDEKRCSELTVPVIHEGKLLAVIDSEHRKKNFFRSRDLQALQSIASLCAERIARSQAEEAMRISREELLLLNKKMAEAKFLNLRLQMNPHFLFNSLSSIQHLIVSGQTQKAYRYLTVFSNFLRSLLNFAEKNFILLEQEIKIMTMYIELESLRFDESFSWEIKADDSLLQEVVSVPSLLIQPFAENAIWHGLLHKDGPKKLTVHFKAEGDESLTCIIEDNGIGRAKALEIREQNINARLRESKGISIIKERLALLQQKTGEPTSIEFEDLYDEANQPAGTRVRINIPYYNPEEI